jgi:hypothetical protein
MVEIWWHRRETRRQTENTNFDLQHWEEPGYSTAEGISSSRSVPPSQSKVAAEGAGAPFAVLEAGQERYLVDLEKTAEWPARKALIHCVLAVSRRA